MSGDYEIDILQWGTNEETDQITVSNVSEIYEPEQDTGTVVYENSKFSEIPEWLFSKKVKSRYMSRFYKCDRITSIPENLFKNNVNIKNFGRTFEDCRGLTNIPENLFKYNVNVTNFLATFDGCRGLTSIPENLFKNNVNATYFGSTFKYCIGLTSIPENLFKNNVKITDFLTTFSGCKGLLYIPNTIIEHAKRVKEKGGNANAMFEDCRRASNYNSLSEYFIRFRWS